MTSGRMGVLKWVTVNCKQITELSTECWDSPPIACNLREAFRGFPKDDRWCEGASHAISIIQRSTAKSSASIQVQKICYDALIQYRFVDSFHHTNRLYGYHLLVKLT